MPPRISDEQAAADMRAAGLEPLEPYPGTIKPWRSQCAGCGEEVTPRLNTIRNGGGGCRRCGYAKTSERLRTSPREAEAEIHAAGLEPLEPYPGLKGTPWRCRCTGCGREVTPRLGNIRNGHSGCRSCAGSKASTARIDPAEAEANMRAVDLEPLEPYPGATKPWHCRCNICGEEVAPQLSWIRSGQRGCRHCGIAKRAAANRVDSSEAEADMRAVGLEPLDPYLGRHIPWRCKCLTCGNEVMPQFGSIRNGRGCRYCSIRKAMGRSAAGPAMIYVLHHGHYGAVKVGIAGQQGERIRKFQRDGWQPIATIYFPCVEQAFKVEQAVLRRLRVDMGLSHFLTADYMGKLRGWTETFDAELITPNRLKDLVRKEAVSIAS